MAEPGRLFAWGEAGASSTIVTIAVRVPAACGLNVTVITQFALKATVAPQVFVCVKSPGFGPASAMLEMCNVPVPELVSVNPCEAPVLPTIANGNVKLPGTSVTAGVGFRPSPLSTTMCGLPAALSVMFSDAARSPTACGVNVMLNEQLAPELRVAAQLFVCEKSVGFAPAIEIVSMVSVAKPELVRVIGVEALWPMSVLLKANVIGENVTAGAAN